MTESQGKGLTGLGKMISVLLVLGLVALGGWIVYRQMNKPAPNAGAGGGGPAGGGAAVTNPPAPSGKVKLDPADLTDTKTAVNRLPPPIAYVPAKPDVIDIELSKYAGYAGVIAANGGLTPNPDSVFAKKYGFQLNIRLSEAESWPALNAGKMAASATTADVLAVYGRQFQVVVPIQIGYSRGADAVVVRSGIKNVNQLKGKVVASCQFTEADFFIRYLAKEAGIEVNMMDPASPPDADKINLVYCDDGEAVQKLMSKDIAAGGNNIAAGVTWAPFTTKIVDDSGGKANILVSNKNLLIIADILIVNRGFAEKNPDKVAGLVDGILAGNKAVRADPQGNADVIGKAFGWNRAQTLAELQKVHLANLPENQAFFSGGITAGGSFASIYGSAVLDYGNALIPNAVDSDYFVSPDALKKADASGAYKDQVAAIVPIQAKSGGALEADPLLSKDIRFLFEPNKDNLDLTHKENLDNLAAIKKLLDVSPGSHVILVGHVDPLGIPEIRSKYGQAMVDKAALDAMELSKRRATEIMKQLIALQKVDATRLETVGRGWTQPVSQTNGDMNRRVEVQWFTLE